MVVGCGGFKEERKRKSDEEFFFFFFNYLNEVVGKIESLMLGEL